MSDEFDAWYALYPRKVAKGAARKAFVKARKIAPHDILCAAVAKFAERCASKEKQFIPYPATWLNQERWLDTESPDGGGKVITSNELLFKRIRLALTCREIMVDRQEVMLALQAQKITPEEAKRLGL